MLMMMSHGGRRRLPFPFTEKQLEELQQQSLVLKYMVCGMSVPPDLLFSIRTSLHSSHSLGWNSLQYGTGRKTDPEPWRCRRTDGKKWRCSKEAYPDSKYCEKHMHRGRNRSRKPVEDKDYYTRNHHPAYGHAFFSDSDKTGGASSVSSDSQPKKVMHHFLEEWPNCEDNKCTDRDSHATQLSISIDPDYSLHDFFMTQK